MSNVLEDVLEIMAFPWPELKSAKTEKTVQEMQDEVPPRIPDFHKRRATLCLFNRKFVDEGKPTKRPPKMRRPARPTVVQQLNRKYVKEPPVPKMSTS